MIKVSKYHGLGNDFVMMDYQDVKGLNHSEMAKVLCDRRTGIGSDGLIIVKQHPLEMIYYNGDGSRAQMCGNGIRCFSKYLYDNGITNETTYDVVTLAGTMKINVLEVEPFIVEVNMGQPDYHPKEIPSLFEDEVINKTFNFNDEFIVASSLLMGVPHTVTEIDKFDIERMVSVGRFFETNEMYPQGTNVNFYQILNHDTIKMQTFERGAGLTLACGTGACATFAHLYRIGLVNNNCAISLPLGELVIREENKNIFMSGPAVKVMDGVINEEGYKW